MKNFIKNLSYLLKKENHKVDLESQISGGLLGFAIGDALGVPYEFQSREAVQGANKMIGYGTHKQSPGSWSDDSSLTFCLVQNIINGYDIEILKELFCEWYYYGLWTHDGNLPFDIGQSTFKALSKIKAGISHGETGEKTEKSNGNGSVMRVLPLCFYLLHAEDDKKFPLIEDVSGITHAHMRSKIACSIYVEYGIQLIHTNNPIIAYKNMKETIHRYYEKRDLLNELKSFHRILEGNIKELSVDEIRSSGYVVDSLESCLWSFLNSSSYEEAVWTAIHLGDDTDTIGAMTGGFAGIYYGKSSIPKKWIKKLARNQEIEKLAEYFYYYLKNENRIS